MCVLLRSFERPPCLITLEDRTLPNSFRSLLRCSASSRSERSIFRARHTVSALMPCRAGVNGSSSLSGVIPKRSSSRARLAALACDKVLRLAMLFDRLCHFVNNRRIPQAGRRLLIYVPRLGVEKWVVDCVDGISSVDSSRMMVTMLCDCEE